MGTQNPERAKGIVRRPEEIVSAGIRKPGTKEKAVAKFWIKMNVFRRIDYKAVRAKVHRKHVEL